MIWINWRLVQIWTLCTLLGIAAFSVTGCGKMFKRGWSVEPPAPQYASGPTQTGRTTELRVTPEQANYLCHIAGVWTHEPQGFPVACYNPRTDQVILPDKWPSQDELNQMRSHEWSHARGERHNDDGTGVGPASLPPMAWVDPAFHPDDPQNLAPLYRGPAPPVTMTAQVNPTTATPTAPSGFGFAVRSGR